MTPRARGRLSSARTLAVAGAISMTAGLLLLPAATPSLAAAQHAAKHHHKKHHHIAALVTVTGPRMLNYNTVNAQGKGHDYRRYSTVTVSPVHGLTNQTIRVSWTGFTRSNLLGSASPYYQFNSTLYPVMVVECRGVHPQRINQCWQASNYQEQFGSDSNAVYMTTANNGTGQAYFQIQTALQNSWLGCDSKHPCSLAVVPAQGGFNNDCANHSQDGIPGQSGAQGEGFYSFGGTSSKCAWAKRVVVPLTFAPLRPCPHIQNPDLRIVGSPMMSDAMAQWDTGLCRQAHSLAVAWNPAVGEPTGILETVQDGLSDVALTTRPAPSVVSGHRRYTYAPVGVTAAAFAFWFDNPNTGQPYTQVRLDQRLVAKELTTSYTDYFLQCSPGSTAPCDRSVSGNPSDMFNDPEFTGLNKHVQEPIGAYAEGLADVPIVVGGLSDMTYEVTRWVAGSAFADEFLAGRRDHWGMHVNKRYRGIKYPISTFTSRDPSLLLQAAYSPTATLADVTSAMVQGQPPGSNGFQPLTTGCPPAQQCFNPLSGEPDGDRALLAVTDEADAATFLMPTAAIRNGAGRYVTPTQKSMAAALRSMVTAKNGITQQVNLKSKNPAEYPLTMVVYALVPIGGISHAKAVKISRWLDYVTGPGQQQGEVSGKLPMGYLPLPRRLRAQAQHVATEVLDQTGNTKKSSSPSPTPSGSASPSSTPTPTGSSTPTASSSATPTASQSAPTTQPTPTISYVALRRPSGAGLTRYALPALLIIAGLAALLGGSIGAFTIAPGALGRLRRRGSTASGQRITSGQRIRGNGLHIRLRGLHIRIGGR
jgi:hypothetical protein